MPSVTARERAGIQKIMTTIRDNWKSKTGFVLAAAGSAVGLGNLWKFPYLTWENEGGAFVIIYLVAVFLIGLPLMMCEILVGRKTQLNPVPAFIRLGGKGWSGVGWLGVASGAIILSYYHVVAGWSLRAFVQCLDWSLYGYRAPGEHEFNAFLSNGPLQIGLTLLFTLFTASIVYHGIGRGIEKANRILMPVLLCILGYLVITALTMDGRGQALEKIFVPDFSRLKPEGYLQALGQAFFSLSLGLGAMIAYGSYLSKKESIARSAVWVVILDTMVAILACVVMFTIIFSVSGLETRLTGSTIGMLFITLPDLFYTVLPGGVLLGPLFFLLVALAAL
ncbi:MAG TPA: sodium-dependent transporter, partial [Acidobacteriota bacterium]|nr:sodium-dependent transporter [Acidobacteriota bacterium]